MFFTLFFYFITPELIKICKDFTPKLKEDIAAPDKPERERPQSNL